MKKNYKSLLVILLASLLASCQSSPTNVTGQTTINGETAYEPGVTQAATETYPTDVDETQAETEAETEESIYIPRVIYTVSPLGPVSKDIEVSADVSSVLMDRQLEDADEQKGDRTLVLNGETIPLSYAGSQRTQNPSTAERISVNYSKDEYTDELGNPVSFYRGTDVLHKYMNLVLLRNHESDTDPKKSRDELVTLGRSLMQELAGFDAGNDGRYKETVKEKGQTISLVYSYYFCGYETTTQYSIRLTKTGKVIDYSSHDAFLYREWDGRITTADIEAAVSSLVLPSSLGGEELGRELIVGNDGYLYVYFEYYAAAYTEYDDQGNVVEEHPSKSYTYYVRVTTGA